MQPTFHYDADPTQAAIGPLAAEIAAKLDAGLSVLWIVTGGSGIAVTAGVARLLNGADLGRLHVMLSDERYGEVGHADSNWQQMLDMGIELRGAHLMPTLDGGSLEETVAAMREMLGDLLYHVDYKVGLFGLGADGHTAGMLPGSPAVESSELAEGYEAADYVRVTMTAGAIAHLDHVYLVAHGEAKWPQLQRLAQDLKITEQPAQALKQVSRLDVYSDNAETAS